MRFQRREEMISVPPTSDQIPQENHFRRWLETTIAGKPPKKVPTIWLPRRIASKPARYLSVVATIKNEGRYLREWIEFQRLMGAEQIYLYDNGSIDNTN